jgi:hypothetical protein
MEQQVDMSVIKAFRLDLTRITLDGLEEEESQEAHSSAISSRKRTRSDDPRRALAKKARDAILNPGPLAPEEESELEGLIARIQRMAPAPIQGHSERDLELHESPSASSERSIGQRRFCTLRKGSRDSPHRLARGSTSH